MMGCRVIFIFVLPVWGFGMRVLVLFCFFLSILSQLSKVVMYVLCHCFKGKKSYH